MDATKDAEFLLTKGNFFVYGVHVPSLASAYLEAKADLLQHRIDAQKAMDSLIKARDAAQAQRDELQNQLDALKGALFPGDSRFWYDNYQTMWASVKETMAQKSALTEALHSIADNGCGCTAEEKALTALAALDKPKVS